MNFSETSELKKGGAYGAAPTRKRSNVETNANRSGLNTQPKTSEFSGRGVEPAPGLVKHSGFSRTAFNRILRVATEIRNRPAIRVHELAAMMDTCHKTIYRDIDFLKDVGAPITFNYELNSWVWNVLAPTPWYFGGTIQDPNIV